MDYKIELIPLAVTDVDRAVDFYGNGLGWSVDPDGNRWALQQLVVPGQ